jgi:hypothetical protein
MTADIAEEIILRGLVPQAIERVALAGALLCGPSPTYCLPAPRKENTASA